MPSLADREPTDLASAPVVGRDREVAELDLALDGAFAGRASLVLLTGEAGIGKTHLARAVSERAAARGALVAWGAGWDGGGAPTYWPWIQVVRGLLRGLPAAVDLATLAGPLAAIVPELRGLASGADGGAGAADPEEARFQLFEALALLLDATARAQPLVVVLDDVHWVDDASVRALEFVARSLHDAPVLLLATYREADLRRDAELSAALGGVVRAARRIPLGGLAEEAVTALVARHAHGEVIAPLAGQLHELTGGNAFFAEELGRLLAAHGRPTGTLPLPDGVRDAIGRRVAGLAPRTADALALAAVVGGGFRVATLVAAAGVDQADVLAALDEAAGDGLVEQREGGMYAFRHALVRETLLRDLPVARRAELHAAVGRALERRHAGALDPVSGELAFHFLEAVPVVPAAEAFRYAVAAGRRAMSLYDWADAVSLLDRAAELGERLEPDDARDAELWQALGDARLREGDLPGAREAFGRVAVLARRMGDACAFARAALASAPWGLSAGGVEEELVALLEEAVELLGAATGERESDALRARAQARLGAALYWSAEAAERRAALAEEAIALARRTGDDEALAHVLVHAFLARWGPESYEDGLRDSAEILELCRRTGDREVELNARSWRITLLFGVGDRPSADAEIEAYGQLAGRLRQARVAFFDPLHRSMRAALDGRWGEAEAETARAAELGAQAPGSIAPLLCAAQLALNRLAQRRGGELEPAVRQLADTVAAMPAWRVALLHILHQAGRSEEARQGLRAFAAHDFGDLPRDNLWLLALARLAEVASELEEVEAACRLHALLAPYEERVVVSPEAAVVGPVARFLGMLALASGDATRALAHLSRAEEIAERLCAPPNLAEITLLQARAHTARGEGEAAAARAARAAELADRAGLPHVRAAAERIVSAPSPTTSSEEREGVASLRREGDVWTVALGERAFSVRDAKGLRQLAVLLERPGEEVHALDVVAAAEGHAGDARVRSAGDAGPALDEDAKRAYRERFEDVRAELDEAEAFNDPVRAERARTELEWLERELTRAVGLGGRDRVQSSDAERARVNVTRSIRAAVKRIAERDAELGRLLETTVRTGTFCAYEPDPRWPVRWTVA